MNVNLKRIVLSRFYSHNYISASCIRRRFSAKQPNYNSPTQTTSFAKNLFRGKAQLSDVFPYPKVVTGERLEMLESFTGLMSKYAENDLHPEEYDRKCTYPDKVMSDLKEMGAFGLQTPEELGGLGLSNSEYARLVAIVGGRDLALGIVLGSHQSIGYKGIILFGNDAQKAKYLPTLASGEKIAAFALTEPDAGSDAASVQTKAVPSPDGSHFVMNGSKIWISNGGFADIFTVFAKVPVKQDDGTMKDKMTAFIVDRAFGGVTSSPPEDKMGIRASNTASVYFDNVKVPAENLLGDVGGGFKVAMNILNQGRFGMAGALSGTMRSAIAQTVEHASTRKQFGSTLDSFQAIQEKLVQMAVRHYTTESMAFMLSGIMDLGAKDFQIEAAISKVLASENAWHTVDDGIQVLGGMGFMREAGLERVLRDLRVFRIFEGANDILRLSIALEGLKFKGQHLTAASKSLAGMLGLLTGRISRSLHMTGNGKALMSVVPSELQSTAKRLGEAIDAFGGTSEGLLMKYKKDIMAEQCRLMRLADAAMHIYAVACNLSRCNQSIHLDLPSAEYEGKLVKVASNMSLMEIERKLSDITSPPTSQNYSLMKELSSNLVSSKGVVQPTPLGI